MLTVIAEERKVFARILGAFDQGKGWAIGNSLCLFGEDFFSDSRVGYDDEVLSKEFDFIQFAELLGPSLEGCVDVGGFYSPDRTCPWKT